jgi:hypothetical protein
MPAMVINYSSVTVRVKFVLVIVGTGHSNGELKIVLVEP